ncbi:acetyl/propionyl/methylcrotonyl-CoA carboxylase subunit alpha [Dyella psychrodurans]|uniref:Biotin carboxylase n=1 Tax=Dyella psychrodurans TaxID=1927960 RepID=A0A370WXZ0_9GAMM|nr:acetyl/propionyl/methylcrotonyl-CoA carboxylase subunit alpha [Dyella psychrodurans]RDS81008.1 acetyl/propionyl/methylcrotonyl-CoA carboxylase subunit alpha [Dyella psychrodurans]
MKTQNFSNPNFPRSEDLNWGAAGRFDKVLVANRGEIACRIIKTCRRMGIQTVAVYSDADANSRHVRLADEAVRIGPAPARESYLLISRIIDAARSSGAQAVHPGYGFLSENEAFAWACIEAGKVFIGPSVAAIRAMGSKSDAKALMENAAVPLTPGYHGANQDVAFLREQADLIGYPVLIKASAGGGGKGIRRVDASGEFEAALMSCKREAAASFGDDRVLVEKYLLQPRHIEVQVFGDSYGNVVHLFERDCSVQRRHQKVLEEAPAPGMTDERREAMGRAACAAARAVGYVGAGTVEFIVGPDGTFYFMEMNTRLQVEHAVTEMITGLDLVEWQLRVAAGDVLPLRQEQLAIRGHSIEARIYAEDTDKNFLPSVGRLIHLMPPPESAHVRVDTGIEQGDEITSYYDPMIAKLIVWDESREQALQRMVAALAQYQVVGVASNIDFLSRLVTCTSFVKAELDTSLIERERDALWREQSVPTSTVLLAALAHLLYERREILPAAGDDIHSPWRHLDGWRLNGVLKRRLTLLHGDFEFFVDAEYSRTSYCMTLNEHRYMVSGELTSDGVTLAWIDGERVRATVFKHNKALYIFADNCCCAFTPVDPLEYLVKASSDGGGLLAPMPGRVVALLVKPGEMVTKGTPLLVLEAMKMEHAVIAPEDGFVIAFRFATGEQVSDGSQLVDFERSL